MGAEPAIAETRVVRIGRTYSLCFLHESRSLFKQNLAVRRTNANSGEFDRITGDQKFAQPFLLREIKMGVLGSLAQKLDSGLSNGSYAELLFDKASENVGNFYAEIIT